MLERQAAFFSFLGGDARRRQMMGCYDDTNTPTECKGVGVGGLRRHSESL